MGNFSKTVDLCGQDGYTVYWMNPDDVIRVEPHYMGGSIVFYRVADEVRQFFCRRPKAKVEMSLKYFIHDCFYLPY
jgi:hypothetical protein